jgi:CheY-like chemotaxis protein
MHIVALAAGALAGDQDRCIAAGGGGCLVKPFSLRRLPMLVERVQSSLGVNR